MAVELDYVNGILSELAIKNVQSINDNETSLFIYNRLRVLYVHVLQRANWNFAVEFIYDASPMVYNISPNYQYTYLLPADFGHLFKFTNQILPTVYEIVDGYLLCNSKPVQYEYIKNNQSLSVFPPLVMDMIVLYVASRVCLVLTQDIKLTSYLKSLYEERFSECVRVNAFANQIDNAKHINYDRPQVW